MPYLRPHMAEELKLLIVLNKSTGYIHGSHIVSTLIEEKKHKNWGMLLGK